MLKTSSCMTLPKKLLAFQSVNTSILRQLVSLNGQWPITCTFNHNCTLNHFKEIEERWKPILNEKWKNYSKTVDTTSENHRYVLSMFPYPSGSLHLGHVRIYTTTDVLTRFFRQRGNSVVNPMGWDSFGLPAENAALERSMSPAIWTYQNIKTMEAQLKSLGLNLNWREATSDLSFYRWTQWLFLQLFNEGLIFKSMSCVNWDPVDKTVLADDQVDEDGKSWRSGAKVEKRFLRQWNIKISAFHDELYQFKDVNLNNQAWKELAANQKFFLGEPDTYIFYLNYGKNILPILCDFPEYLAVDGSYIAVNKDHWILESRNPESIKVINPLSNQEMEVRVLNEEDQDKLPSSGRAIILHPDKPISENLRDSVLRDCTKLGLGGYKTSKKSHDWVISRQRYWGTPIPIIDCPSCGPVAVPTADLPVALPQVKDINPLYELEEKDAIKGRLGLVAPKEWLDVNCPKCNRPSVRETDTCDTFFDSSWYYLRYATEPSDSQAFDKETNRKPVHLYVGGAEHSRGHLLYARYIFHFLKSRGFIDSSSNEPFRNLLFLGYVLGRTIKYNDRFITEDEQQKLIDSKKVSPDDFVISCEKMSKSKGNGLDPMQLIDRYGIDATRVTLLGFGLPRRAREWHGHKTEYEEIFVILRRLFLTIDQFIFVRELLNETKTAPVVKRFVISREKDQTKIESILTKYDHERKKTIKKVTSVIENEHYPALGVNMLKIFLNLIRKSILNVDVCKKIEFERCLGDIIIMLGPVIPHLAEECWSGFCSAADQKAHKSYYDFQKLVCEQKWPEP
ncbi:uncharacterized protein LOC107360851 [Tetranychus urticae]|uniref:leucine--tRNA ligase n=1 Tax=Tetranychus urticae TaxID=32264 RepID=T1JTC1_TETUR|nr:uncharacterized protein LOC107360851 [Tetranychus urticae]